MGPESYVFALEHLSLLGMPVPCIFGGSFRCECLLCESEARELTQTMSSGVRHVIVVSSLQPLIDRKVAFLTLNFGLLVVPFNPKTFFFNNQHSLCVIVHPTALAKL